MRGLVRISTGKGNSVKRSGPFSEPLDSETEKLLLSSPSRKSALREGFCRNPRGIFLNEFAGEFCLVDFGGLYPWNNMVKEQNADSPKIAWELRGQDPHCKNLPLTIIMM